MVHIQGVEAGGIPVKTRKARFGAVLLAAAVWLVGCADTTAPPTDGPFGQEGQIRIEVRSLLGDRGYLDEILIWLSDGPWLLTERVIYEGNIGSETSTSTRLNPGELAQEYRSLIRLLNEEEALVIFGDGVPQGLAPDCATDEDLANPSRLGDELPDTRVRVVIEDETRDLQAIWVRCAEGTLLGEGSRIIPSDARPLGTGADRVITAAQLARSFSVGGDAASTYKGTVPFAALDQGQHSVAEPDQPRAFISTTGSAPADFRAFWEAHAGPAAPLPQVDWESELVLLAAVGRRTEAGDVIRVRRVEGLGQAGTRVRLVERVPGDFCSPAALESHPYQLVVVPVDRLTLPIRFADVSLERIPCG